MDIQILTATLAAPTTATPVGAVITTSSTRPIQEFTASHQTSCAARVVVGTLLAWTWITTTIWA